jgi:uncharacterized protein YgbK (DUF1537 family)
MIRVGIVADDLTGAADTASQFVRTGWQTELQLRPGASAAQVVAVTTDSRCLTASDAAKTVTDAVAHLRKVGVTHLYKKVDSTLRGHLRAEITAALDSWSPNAIAVVCPAFPAMGRTLVAGRLCVNGVPVSESGPGVDPLAPVSESHVPTLIGGSHVAHEPGASARTLADRIAASGRIVVVDAADDGQMQRLAEAVALLDSRTISVGSAGLAGCLARVWNVGKNIPLGIPSVTSAVKGAITSRIAIVIVTSLQDVARRQAAAVAAAGATHGQPAPSDLIEDDAWERWSGEILDGLGTSDSTRRSIAASACRRSSSLNGLPISWCASLRRLASRVAASSSRVATALAPLPRRSMPAVFRFWEK